MAGGPHVFVVGAGLAGLSCAVQLAEHGVRAEVLETSPHHGGRVQTDEVDGFLLDRGFQVLLTAYPEARRVLDYGQLDLRPFEPGALVRTSGGFVRLADPFRRPDSALATLRAPLGTVADKLRVALLRRQVVSGTLPQLFSRQERATLEYLRRRGFSDQMIDQVFRPLFGGILLDRSLSASSRMFEFVFRMLATGDAALPGRGMRAIPDQLAGRLPDGAVRLETRVTGVEPGAVHLEGGGSHRARAVVVATDREQAAQFLGLAPGVYQGVQCVYFAADAPPVTEPLILLDGEGRGPVTTLCVPSVVAPGYAPSGSALVSAMVLDMALTGDQLVAAVRQQLSGWFGTSVAGWRHLRTYTIEQAQPAQPPGSLEPPMRPVRVQRGLYVCGDHRDTASIQGAMLSGRRAADAVLADLAG